MGFGMQVLAGLGGAFVRYSPLSSLLAVSGFFVIRSVPPRILRSSGQGRSY